MIDREVQCADFRYDGWEGYTRDVNTFICTNASELTSHSTQPRQPGSRRRSVAAARKGIVLVRSASSWKCFYLAA